MKILLGVVITLSIIFILPIISYIKFNLAIVLAIITVLLFDYVKSKRYEKILLDKIISYEIVPNEIKITPPDGDGYQSLKITYLKNKNNMVEDKLAGHFDIERFSVMLKEKGFNVQGTFVRH